MGQQSLNGGRFLATTLSQYGVSHVFFVDAILRHALANMEDFGIQRILAHSEKAAAYMADGFARVARRPVVCMSQSVGAANLAAGLQDAFFAGSPVIALTGRHIAQNQYRNAYQELPHQPFFQEVTKFSGRIEAPEQMAHLLRHAFHSACAGKTAPVHLDVAGNTGSVMDYWPAPSNASILATQWGVPAYRPRPDTSTLKRAAEVIRKAQKPLIVAGLGIHWSHAEAALRKFVEHAHIPLATTLDMKHLLTDEHPLNAGVIGTYGSDATNKFAATADLIIFIGCDTSDQATANWTLPTAHCEVIQIDIAAEELGRNVPHALCLQADPHAALNDLLEVVNRSAVQAWEDKLRSLREEWNLTTQEARHSNAIPLRPERVCQDLGEWLPDDAILVTDTGYSSQWAAQMLPIRSNNLTFLRAAGSLGWGFPAALGAKAAAPNRPVICFTGDGGFMYHLTELETAKRWNLNTITVVNNNEQFAQGLKNLRVAYEGRDGRMDDCYRFGSTDFAKLAESFGCVGMRVDSSEQLVPALQRALAADAPVVIDVRTDPSALAPIPWMPQASA